MRHTINLEPQDESLDGRQLERLVRLWLERLERRPDLSPATVTGYANRVQYFLDWWADVGPWCDWELTKDKLLQFGSWLSTVESQYRKPLSFNSRRDVLRRLRQCLAWAFRHGYISRDITPWLPAADGAAPLRERATKDELAMLMRAAGRSGCPVRDQAFVALLIGTGLRKMEAVGLDVTDIKMDADQSGTATVRKAKKVKGRTVQGRVVAFDSWTGRYVGRLLDVLPVSGPLFCTPEGSRRIGGMAAYRVVRRAIERAGLVGRLQGPHDLRRNFATWYAKEHKGEMHARLLSKQLGHARFVQTDQYILHDADDLAEVIRSPLADFDHAAMVDAPRTRRRRVQR